MKRAAIFTVLIISIVACFWYALSGVEAPKTASLGSGGKATPSSSGSAKPSQARGGQTQGSGNGAALSQGNSGHGSAGAGGSSGGASGDSGQAASNVATTSSGGGSSSSSSNPLTCRMQCQDRTSTCEATCYRSYDVTNQTPGWSACMQTCNTKGNACSNTCGSGIVSPLSNPPMPAAIAPSAAKPPSQSAKTPSLPIQMPDSSTSSSSSGQ